MPSKKDHENMDTLDSCYKLVQQSSAKGGIRAVEIAEKLGVHKTTVYDRLKSLEFAGKVRSDQGLWKATTGEQTIKLLEKEIEITLPLPEKKFEGMMGLKVFHKSLENSGLSMTAEMIDTIIETFNQTRTIKIKCKNVDDLDLDNVTNLILQANEKSSKFNLKRKLKKLKP